MNYSYLYKKSFKEVDELKTLDEYDCFISMFVPSERVIIPADRIPTKETIWFTFPDYIGDVFLTGKKIIPLLPNEDYVTITNAIKDLDLNGKKICLDATGFNVPNMLFLLRLLHSYNIKKFDVLYTEPKSYMNAENTEFSEEFKCVKQIMGMGGKHNSDTDNDLLIIAAGYDHSRIIDVAVKKKPTTKALLFGFPSMSAEMFQENIIRAYNASEAVGSDCFKDMDSNIYAPAYDPFVTAQTLKEFIEHKNARKKLTNIYLAPLSSKPQALGMALYYIGERCWLQNISIIYPFCQKYNLDRGIGISRIWLYNFEFPW